MTSPIAIRCECGNPLHVGDDAVGRVIKCRSCGSTMEVRARSRTRVKVRPVPSTWWRPLAKAADWIESRLGPTLGGVFRGAGRFLKGEWRAATMLPRPARLTMWLAYGYLLLAILAWILIWGFGDAWWPGTILLFIGRWILLLPLAVLVPAALLFRRTTIAPLVLAGLIVVGPVMGFETGWRRWLPYPTGTPIRVVTFNTEGGDLFAMQLPEQLRTWSADIIALQECGPVLRDEIRRLPDWTTHEEHGVCLLSRYPITAVAVMDRSGFAYMQEFDPRDIGGSADVVRYTLAAPGGAIDVTTVHLETPRKGLEGFLSDHEEMIQTAPWRRLQLNTELRNIESRAARAWAEGSPHRKLVIGDFNTPIESRIFQRHWGDLTDAFSEVGFGLGRTKDNGWIRVRIDHVLYGPGWHAQRAVVGPSLGSDHRPVIVDLVLKGT